MQLPPGLGFLSLSSTRSGDNMPPCASPRDTLRIHQGAGQLLCCGCLKRRHPESALTLPQQQVLTSVFLMLPVVALSLLATLAPSSHSTLAAVAVGGSLSCRGSEYQRPCHGAPHGHYQRLDMYFYHTHSVVVWFLRQYATSNTDSGSTPPTLA